MSETKTYEQNQQALEEIVSRLESGNVPLEEMIRLYEQGEALYRVCAETLDAYEKRLDAFEQENVK
jgi:exodeoxyribonuclease VII small subunit